MQEFFVQWHLTERCNLACAHCYQEAPRNGELSAVHVRRCLDEIRATLAYWQDAYELPLRPLLHLTGGEPLLDPAFWDVLEHGRQLGFGLAVLTNGTLVGEREAEKLAALGVESVQVSVEGPPPVHDAIRGAGSLALALAGTARLVAAGVMVTFSLTLSRLNAPYLREVAELAAGSGATRLGVSRLVACGRGRGLAGQSLVAAELQKVYAEMNVLSLPGLEIVPKDPLNCLFGPPPGEDAREVPLGGCSAGISGVTVLSDGTLMPCRRMNLPIGNLQETSFRELWVASPVLEHLRRQENFGGRCRICPYWTVCRGCRAVAAAGAGPDAYLAEDPDCWWEPDAVFPLAVRRSKMFS